MILLRKALRDIRAMGARALLLVLVIGAGVGMAAGIGLALGDVRATRDAFYRDQALADLDVRLQRPIPAGVLAARARDAGARDAGATLAETRLVLDGTASRLHGALNYLPPAEYEATHYPDPTPAMQRVAT
jgi:putative ABC transport system permease protein